MIKPSAVIDSSALINLVQLNLAQNLQLYFQAVYVPRKVQSEVNRKGRFRYRLKKLYDKGVFTRCRAGNAVNVKLLAPLDEGEAEALVQASEIGATIFVGDETAAREIGERRGLQPIGTARILARLHLEGLADDPYRLVGRLRRELRFRISDTIVEQAIQAATRPIS